MDRSTFGLVYHKLHYDKLIFSVKKPPFDISVTSYDSILLSDTQ